MALLIDSSLWVDFTRARSPRSLKLFISTFVLDPAAHLAEPVVFEIMRNATPVELPHLTSQFQAVPMLASPPDLWSRAAGLGRVCRAAGLSAGSLDLLIATIAIEHGAELVTFDPDYQRIAKVSSLQAKVLTRPAP